VLTNLEPVAVGSQMFAGHRLANINPIPPGTLVCDAAGNQFGLIMAGQPDGSGGELKIPAVAKGHGQLLAGRCINGDIGDVSRRDKPS